MKFLTGIVELTRPVQGTPLQRVKARVDLSIDDHALFVELGNRALRNKSKRTVEIGGLVIASVVNVEVIGNVERS